MWVLIEWFGAGDFRLVEDSRDGDEVGREGLDEVDEKPIFRGAGVGVDFGVPRELRWSDGRERD
ncbi:MAG: hypothetical protein Q9Q40_09315 [Acidobacteriota bacterium]|nr:hypothetical protein [Acidobacteriota bacterium]